MSSKTASRVEPLEVLYLGQTDSNILSSSISCDGTQIFLGLEGGTLEASVLVRKDENVWCSSTTRKPLSIKEDDIQNIYHVASLRSILIHTRENSLLLYDLNTGQSKLVQRNHVFAVSLDDNGAHPVIAILRTTGLTKALVVSTYIIESAGLKFLWQCKLAKAYQTNEIPSIAFIESPSTLLVYANAQFTWVGIDPVTQNPTSRTVLMKQGNGITRVVSAPGRDGQALILSDDIGIMMDSSGGPVGNSISLSELDSPLNDAVVLNSTLIIVTQFLVHIIDLESGDRSTEDIVDPQGSSWRLGTSGQVANSFPISLHFGTHVWIICSVSPKKQLKKALEQQNAIAGKELIKHYPELFSEYDLMKQCIMFFMRQGLVQDGVKLLEKLGFDDPNPQLLFQLFPEYMKSFVTVPVEKCSLQDIWSTTTDDDGTMNSDREAILEYLFRIRQYPGISNVHGIDTLIVHLLMDMDLKDATLAFLSAPNHAVPKELAERLENKQWQQCFALLCSFHADYVDRAIRVWKDLAIQNVDNVAEAMKYIEITLANASVSRQGLVLMHLPWLFESSKSSALRILECRPDIAVDSVLKILPDSLTKCQYLQLSIAGGENKANSYVNTELALVFVQLLRSQSPEIVSTFEHMGINQTKTTVKNPAIFIAQSFQGLPTLQTLLHDHLIEHAPYIDLDLVISEIDDNMIHEKAILGAIKSDHEVVIDILVNACLNVTVAIEYIKTFVPSEKHHDVLMKYILECNLVCPWDVAGQLIASFDHCTIDATKIIDQMPDDMELCNAEQALMRMIRSIIHRRREKEMMKGILRSRLLSLKVMKKNIQQASPCRIAEETKCSQCSLTIGNTACVQLQNNNMLCLHCYNNNM